MDDEYKNTVEIMLSNQRFLERINKEYHDQAMRWQLIGILSLVASAILIIWRV